MSDRHRHSVGPSGRQLAYAIGITLVILIGLGSPDQGRPGHRDPQQTGAGQEQPARQPAPVLASGNDGRDKASQARQEQAQDQSVGPLRWLVRAALDPDNVANFFIMLFTLALTCTLSPAANVLGISVVLTRGVPFIILR